MSDVLELDSPEVSDHFDTTCDEQEQGATIVVRAESVVRVLLWVVATLIITGTTAHFITHKVAPSPEHKLAKLMNRFDINFEPSIPAWYSACALLASGTLLIFTGIAKKHEKDRFYKQWLFMGALFVGLSMDEAARFHEMLHTLIISQVETHGILYFPWVVPAFIFVAIVGIWNIPFLRHIDRRTAKLFLIAAVIYVGGAVGTELIGGPLAEKYGMPSTPHMISESVEETLEMLGIVAFLYALLDHLARCVKPIRFQVLSNGRQFS
jgi:hypothetical protein